MKNGSIIMICFLLGALIMGQEYTSTNNKNIYYSTLMGAFKVSPILQAEDSIKFESKINSITEKIKTLTTEIDELRKIDTLKVPKHFTLFGGYYTKPKLTEEQKQSKIIISKIKNLKYKIKSLNAKRSNYLKNYNNLKLKDAQFVHKELFWGFIGWHDEKPFESLNRSPDLP